MPTISKIRFTNVVYEGGNKRYNDELFVFDGHNSSIILENGGGKTVFIQTAIQAVLPHTEMAGRKIKETLSLTGTPAHVAIEWILADVPRRYAVTAVTLFMSNNELDSYRYVYEYSEGDAHSIEHIPFAKETVNGGNRPAGKDEIHDYFVSMSSQHMNARTFHTIKEYHGYLEESFRIVPSEWRKIVVINGSEGGVEDFFDACNTTGQLVDQLLIPTVEEALAGSGTTGFAETFEKKREHFKQSKQLRTQIMESQLVEGQIQRYRDVFAEYDQAAHQYERERGLTKALSSLTKSEAAQVNRDLADTLLQKEKTFDDIREIERKKMSREIALDQQKLEHFQTQYKAEVEYLDKKGKALKDAEHQQLTLEYAKNLKRKHEAEENRHYIQIKLAHLDEDEDISQLREELERNTREIKGYFEAAEQKVKKEENILRSQLATQRSRETQLKETANSLRKKQLEASQQEAKWSAISNRAQEQMNRIATKILANPLQETVEDMHPRWKQQTEESEKNQRLYHNHVTECLEKKRKIQNELTEKHDKIGKERDNLHEWKNRCEQVEAYQQKVLIELKELYPNWSYFDSLYAKQSSIIETLLENMTSLEKEKEEHLLQERKATRLSDEYGESSIFMSESELVKLVERWSDQFDYLESGTRFLQEACSVKGVSEQELFGKFPYWSATIITTAHEVNKLAERLEEASDKLRFPVIVASNQEMRAIVDESIMYQPKERQVIPKTWRNNLNQGAFTEWKTTMRNLAGKASQIRKEKERQLQVWRELTVSVQSFFSDYPHDLYQKWKGSWKQSIEAVEQLDSEIREIEKHIKEYDNQWQLYQDKLREEEGKHLALSHRMQEANEYFLQKHEKEQADKEVRLLDEKNSVLRGELNNLIREERSLDEIIEDLKVVISENQKELFRLQGEHLYAEMQQQHIPPLPARSTLELLRRERADLQSSLRQQQASREQLERELSRYENDLARCDFDLKTIQSKAHKEIDSNAEFPIGGEELIQRLGGIIRKLLTEREELQKQVNELSGLLKAQEAQIETKKSFFQEKFPGQDFDQFSTDLESVREQILQEEKNLLLKKQSVEKEESQLKEAAEQLEQIRNLLEKKDERYQFNQASIKEVELPEAEQMSFPYDRVNVAQRRIHILEKAAHDQLAQFERLSAAKERFKQFCQLKIQDIRLREKAISGIENKRMYSDVLEWAQRMSTSIVNGIRLLEEDLRGHDEQLQHFIIQIHDHLKKVAVELAALPKKTSVKIDSYWKPIYSFHVPEWKEEFGKQAVRNHIDWMLTQLDSERFTDLEGKEDIGKMKKWVFTSLQTKQLLHLVMGNDTIKVKCRKVSNDGKVSGALTSWEESNKWSGGEKWSKNMTLFLGILNYLAEKRQHITRNGKRYRTVILDNPFGKASSEHVLDPVFFIAEQLGFQLIALTALAEGKFIRDYFPIVYSCRLRNAINGNASIMTKEKEIKQAYFRDHDPYTMLRLSEHEQLSLFT